jgi:energy-coupling factor transporter ATP-binding protein EcfA2
MENGSYQLYVGKVIMRLQNKICDNPEELLSSKLFLVILKQYIAELVDHESKLLGIFPSQKVSNEDIHLLITTMRYLVKLPCDLVPRIVEGSEVFFRDKSLMNDFIEQMYNYWRRLHRLIICDAIGDRLDQRPYRTFNDTVEKLMHVVRSTYRDLQENVSGNHPKIYRQVSAGAEIAAIAMPKAISYPEYMSGILSNISMIRQVLIYPPMIFNSPMNKRKGEFERIYRNPLQGLDLNPQEWLCYPAKVGPLLVMVYFSIQFFELGFSLCNLFELADDADITRKPDAVYLFGIPENGIKGPTGSETIFFDDEENDLLVATIPCRDEFGYFGYLKKMVLTLHNIRMMKKGRLPFHGALVNLAVRNKGRYTVLILGDTGAGKSETLEALRLIAHDELEDIVIIADDMGSVEISPSGTPLGYGTEMGAFVRLDDLQNGYALGQIDRTIIMNPDQVNARVVIPVTKYDEVVKGYPIDFILYANNYEEVDALHPAIERFQTPDDALEVFREGKVMSKGTTTNTGLVKSYFANIFGPVQYPALHEVLARQYFEKFFEQKIFVGQMRTRLGIQGQERKGPEAAARELLCTIKELS